MPKTPKIKPTDELLEVLLEISHTLDEIHMELALMNELSKWQAQRLAGPVPLRLDHENP